MTPSAASIPHPDSRRRPLTSAVNPVANVELDGSESAVRAWLMEGDPAVRWQVMRDLLGASPQEVAAERAGVATEGWGAQLLELQDVDGRWADSLYSPKWTSTTYTLLLLERLGLPRGDPRAIAGCRQLWDSARWYGGGLTLAKTIREPETCITGMLVLLAASFGDDDPRLDSTVDRAFTRFPFPPQWHFDIVRGLEHFRAAGADRDERLAEAIAELHRARRPDGTWPLYQPYPGRQWFRLEPRGPSRWSTLRALRLLAWWDEPRQR